MGCKRSAERRLRFRRSEWGRVGDSHNSSACTKTQPPFWTHTGWGWTLQMEEINETVNVWTCTFPRCSPEVLRVGRNGPDRPPLGLQPGPSNSKVDFRTKFVETLIYRHNAVHRRVTLLRRKSNRAHATTHPTLHSRCFRL